MSPFWDFSWFPSIFHFILLFTIHIKRMIHCIIISFGCKFKWIHWDLNYIFSCCCCCWVNGMSGMNIEHSSSISTTASCNTMRLYKLQTISTFKWNENRNVITPKRRCRKRTVHDFTSRKQILISIGIFFLFC